MCAKSLQLCPTLFASVNSSPPGSSVHADSPGKNTGVGCHALLQGIFPTQGLNLGFPHCKQISLKSEPWGKPSVSTYITFINLLEGGNGRKSANWAWEREAITTETVTVCIWKCTETESGLYHPMDIKNALSRRQRGLEQVKEKRDQQHGQCWL